MLNLSVAGVRGSEEVLPLLLLATMLKSLEMLPLLYSEDTLPLSLQPGFSSLLVRRSLSDERRVLASVVVEVVE